MGSRTIGVAVIAALLATAGLATAQSFTVTLDAQSDPGDLSPGASDSVTVEVRLEGDGFSCADDEELPVEVTVDGAGGVTGSADPAELTYGNTMGVHNSDSPAGGYNESAQTTVSVQAGTQGGTHDVTVTGSFPGGSYGPPDGSCSGEFPPAEGTTSIPVTVQSDDPAPGGDGDDGTGDDGTDGNQTDGGDGDENGIPFGPAMAPLGLLLAALSLRRR